MIVMKRMQCLAGAAFVAALGVSGPALAEVSFTLAPTTNYVSRGYTNSDDRPTLQGSVDYAHASGAYAGIWASGVDFNDGDEAEVEVDVYAGLGGSLGADLGYDVGYAHYFYPGAAKALDYDYGEFYGALSYPLAPATLKAKVYYSPEYFAADESAWYLTVGADVALPEGFGLGLHLGRSTGDAFDGGFDYTDWRVGVSRALGPANVELAYADANGAGAESNVFVIVSMSF